MNFGTLDLIEEFLLEQPKVGYVRHIQATRGRGSTAEYINFNLTSPDKSDRLFRVEHSVVDKRNIIVVEIYNRFAIFSPEEPNFFEKLTEWLGI